MGFTGERKREYQREWLQGRRDAWIASQGGKCVECGDTEGIEIDHIEPSNKTHSISTLWSRSEAVRNLELAKCQLLCSDCHKRKTYPNLGQFEHGTMRGYVRFKCRCLECSGAQRAYDSARRSK